MGSLNLEPSHFGDSFCYCSQILQKLFIVINVVCYYVSLQNLFICVS